MAKTHGSGAHERAIGAKPRRPDPGTATVVQNTEPVHFGLGRGEERLAIAKGHRTGDDRQPKIQEIRH